MASVLVLFGGRSAEHEISCVSAAAVARAVAAAGHAVTLVGIDRSGGWHLVPAGETLRVAGPEVVLEVPAGRLQGPDGSIGFDVVFPALHGPYGEDGTLQGLLEMLAIPYVGAGVFASAAAMDKDMAKRLLRDAGLPVSEYLAVRSADLDEEPARVVDGILAGPGVPAFVKPAALGSSVGITRVDSESDVKQALETAFEHGDKAVVEEAVRGREIEVAVLEGPRTSVPGEIVPDREWYDYDAKYQDDATELVIPAKLSESESVRVRWLAAEAFSTLEISGLARVDFFYEEGGRGFIVNEINTMPGFTPRSMFPLLWEASGIGYAELVDELIRLALRPAPGRRVRG